MIGDSPYETGSLALTIRAGAIAGICASMLMLGLIMAGPADALNTFLNSDLDILVMDRFVASKEQTTINRMKRERTTKHIESSLIDKDKQVEKLACPV